MPDDQSPQTGDGFGQAPISLYARSDSVPPVLSTGGTPFLFAGELGHQSLGCLMAGGSQTPSGAVHRGALGHPPGLGCSGLPRAEPPHLPFLGRR